MSRNEITQNSINHQRYVERQSRVLEESGVPASVGHALDDWTKWMQQHRNPGKYPCKSSVFLSGGINCFDDMEHEALSYAGRAVDGAMSSLKPVEILCFGILWLGHADYSNAATSRLNVDAVVIAALPTLHRGLISRGVC